MLRFAGGALLPREDRCPERSGQSVGGRDRAGFVVPAACGLWLRVLRCRSDVEIDEIIDGSVRTAAVEVRGWGDN